MVRGRTFYNGDVLRNRRAASVPAEDLSYRVIDAGPYNKANVITNHAQQDTDSLTAASRRHDRNFLNNISNKLSTANLAPYGYVSNSTSMPDAGRYPLPSSTQHPVNDHRRRTWYGPPAAPVNDYEVNNYLTRGTPRRSIYIHPRGVSVPPVMPSRPSVPRWFPSTVIRGASVPRWTPTPGYSRESLAPYEDVVVGVAHTSQYGDIVIGIPYHKRFMFNAEQNSDDIKDNNYYMQPHFTSHHSLATKEFSRPSIVSVKPGYRRASIAVPYTSSYDDDDYISTSPYYRSSRKPILTQPLSSSYNHPSQHIETSDYEYDLISKKPLPSLSSLYGRSHSAGRKLNGIPEFNSRGSINSHELMAGRSSYVHPVVNPISYAQPIAGGTSLALPPRGPKLPISEARRKVRNLLCKSKNDPTYYEY